MPFRAEKFEFLIQGSFFLFLFIWFSTPLCFCQWTQNIMEEKKKIIKPNPTHYLLRIFCFILVLGFFCLSVSHNVLNTLKKNQCCPKLHELLSVLSRWMWWRELDGYIQFPEQAWKTWTISVFFLLFWVGSGWFPQRSVVLLFPLCSGLPLSLTQIISWFLPILRWSLTLMLCFLHLRKAWQEGHDQETWPHVNRVTLLLQIVHKYN